MKCKRLPCVVWPGIVCLHPTYYDGQSKMAGFHAPPPSDEPRDAVVEAHNARIGLWLFALYASVYAAFVAINAFWPQMMNAVAFDGLNVATIYGLGLIVGAFVVSLVYAFICRVPGGRS